MVWWKGGGRLEAVDEGGLIEAVMIRTSLKCGKREG